MSGARSRGLRRSARASFWALTTGDLVGGTAWGAFVALALLPGALLGALWLASALGGDVSRLAWALPSRRSLQLLANSFLLAATVAVMAAALGTGLAAWMCREGRWPRLVRSFYLLPLLIPPYIQALAWMAIAGRRQLLDQALTIALGSEGPVLSAYGFWPTAMVLTLATFPIVTLLVRTGLEALEPELLEAASLVRTPWPVACRIVFPLVLPSLLAGTGLVFVLALVEYGVPSVLQYNVYVMEIYASFSQDHDPVKGWASSLALLVPATALLVLSQWRLTNSPLRGRPGFRLRLPTASWPLVAQAFLLLSVGFGAMATAAPALVLLGRGGLPTVLATAATTAGREIMRTIMVALASGALATAVALPLAHLLMRRSRGVTLGWLLCALPLTIPAPVTGIALIYLWNQPWLDWGYGTPLMLVIAHVARLLPFAIYAASSQVRHIDPLLVEAAALPAVGWWRRFLWVQAPLAAPAIAITCLVVFILSLGELGVSLLIAPPGEATLPMRIYNLLHYGATDTVAALSLILLVVAGLASTALLLMVRREVWAWRA